MFRTVRKLSTKIPKLKEDESVLWSFVGFIMLKTYFKFAISNNDKNVLVIV